MVWGWLRLKPAAHRFAAALNISHRFRKREFPARYYVQRGLPLINTPIHGGVRLALGGGNRFQQVSSRGS